MTGFVLSGTVMSLFALLLSSAFTGRRWAGEGPPRCFCFVDKVQFFMHERVKERPTPEDWLFEKHVRRNLKSTGWQKAIARTLVDAAVWSTRYPASYHLIWESYFNYLFFQSLECRNKNSLALNWSKSKAISYTTVPVDFTEVAPQAGSCQSVITMQQFLWV